MELKDQVQGVVIGLFGAYAGGYFADLTAQAEAGDPVALAEGLVNLQTPLLGVNLTNDSTWVDTILSHLGVSSTSAAYTAAAAWANGELDAGASRAEVIIAAVTYLLGDDVEAQYAAVATAFKADVAAGVEWSEGDGAEELAISALREEAGNDPDTGAAFNLTTALAELAAANDAVDAYNEAFAEANEDDAGTGDWDESTVDGYHTNAVTNFNADPNSDTNVTTASTDAQVNAAITVARGSAAADIAAAEAAVAVAQANIDAVAGLQAKIDAYDAAIAAAVASQDALDAAATVEAGAAGAYDFNNAAIDLADITVALDGTITVDATADGNVIASTLFEVVDGDLAVIDGVTETTNPGVTDLFNAIVARLAADRADQVADQAEADALTALGGDAGLWTALDTARGDLETANTANTALEADIADLLLARGYDAEQTALEDAVAEALAAIDTADAPYALVELDGAGAAADAAGVPVVNDLYVLNFDVAVDATATITNFGVEGQDLIYIGTGYTLNTGAIATAGDNSVLEVFLTEVGGNATITLETVAYGSNSAATGAESEIVITLTGVALDEITLANGYIQMA